MPITVNLGDARPAFCSMLHAAAYLVHRMSWAGEEPTRESGKFVAYLDGEVFVLRPVEDGIKIAVRQAVSICRETRLAS